MLSLDRQDRLRQVYRAANPNWQPANEVFAALVRRHLAAEAVVLDLGCGRGGLVEQLDHALAQMLGLDPDLSSLREHRLPGLPRAVASGEWLPLRDECIDLAVASWLFEHLADPACTFQEMARVLRPGGLFVFITPNARHPIAMLNRAFRRCGLLQRRVVERLYGRAGADAFPTYYRVNSARLVGNLAEAVGLEVLEVLAIADPTYLAFTPTAFRLMCWLEGRLPASRRVHLVGALRKPARPAANP